MLDLNDMNPAQRKAVTKADGPLLVLAGPGSGKTFTVTGRILYLLEQGVPPEQILVITFTREAALSMQHRFQEVSRTFQPINFGTFHSIFFHILQRSNALKSTKLLTNTEKKKLMFPILKKYRVKSDSDQSNDTLGEDCAAILAAVSYYKNTLREQEAADKISNEWRPYFQRILNEYQIAVNAYGKLDFDDMLSRCRQLLLENERIRKSWQERFRYILIDEFQDINPVQYEVIGLLAGERSQIFAVGDDDQAIYGFRGSEPECLRRFEREYRAERILLDVNYRSHPQIVKASLAVIGENKNRFEKQLRADPIREECGGEERVQMYPFVDKEDQYAYLIDRLGKFHRENQMLEKRKGCAVLFRTNSGMQGLAVRLRSAGIPFVMGERMQSIYEHFIAKDMTAYLTLAAGEWNRESLLRIVNKPSRYISREAVVSSPFSVRQLRNYYEMQEMQAGTKQKMIYHIDNFERQLKALKKLSPGLAAAYVQKAVGYEKYLRSLAAGDEGKLAEWMELLEWLKADAGRFASVAEWRSVQEEHTKALEQGNNVRYGREQIDTDTTIRLMTVHGAKGLEFDTVIIADCNETVFPHGRLQKEAEVEEERRVFYVAMTRAKENLELLYLTGTRDRPRLPSRFLNPLLEG